jgi:very-short-patch-repair endonuclease
MKLHPDRSLGVVALNKPQAELIELEMDRLIDQHMHAQEYRARWTNSLDPFFVKNLESVQGDERDTIFISTVFGHDSDGNFFQRFGPMNSTAGHRRLNVLFTRAKHQVIVFSSIPTEKIIVRPESHWGVRALKGYLEYAKTGQMATGRETRKSADSPFEEAVYAALKQEGFECESQVGVAGFFIDLAVVNPASSDRFILGIECDGASYHSSRSARDRDRLRQEILENLGWTIIRVWSTDWFKDSRMELRKLVDRINQQVRKNPAVDGARTVDFDGISRGAVISRNPQSNA